MRGYTQTRAKTPMQCPESSAKPRMPMRGPLRLRLRLPHVRSAYSPASASASASALRLRPPGGVRGERAAQPVLRRAAQGPPHQRMP